VIHHMNHTITSLSLSETAQATLLLWPIHLFLYPLPYCYFRYWTFVLMYLADSKVCGNLGAKHPGERCQMALRFPQTFESAKYSLRSKRSGIVEIKSQKHGYSIGSRTPNPPIKAPEARSLFPDLFYRGLYLRTLGCTAVGAKPRLACPF